MTTNRERADALTSVLRAIVAGDDGALDGVLTDDVRVWTPEVSVASLRDFAAVIDRRDDAFTDVRIDARPLDVGGDYACAEWTAQMIHSGPIEFADGTSVAASGRAIVLHGVTVAEFDGDRICSLRQYWDRYGLLAQLGPGDHP
jgi:ketosteroid isomerase-like protein